MTRCPDGGTCHHACSDYSLRATNDRGSSAWSPTDPVRCFRVQNCAPLSSVYPDDRWPTMYEARWVARELVTQAVNSAKRLGFPLPPEKVFEIVAQSVETSLLHDPCFRDEIIQEVREYLPT